MSSIALNKKVKAGLEEMERLLLRARGSVAVGGANEAFQLMRDIADVAEQTQNEMSVYLTEDLNPMKGTDPS